MAKLNLNSILLTEKPTLSARAEIVRHAAAEIELSAEPETLAKPAKKARREGRSFSGYTESFEVFWRLYPRPESKGGAFSIWRRLSDADKHKAYAALKDQLGHLVAKRDDPKGNFCPHGSTWLRERRFDDQLTPVTTAKRPPNARAGVTPGIIPFGRYRGHTVVEVVAVDPQYMQWMLSVADREPLRSEIGAALDAAARREIAEAEAEAEVARGRCQLH